MLSQGRRWRGGEEERESIRQKKEEEEDVQQKASDLEILWRQPFLLQPYGENVLEMII